MTVEVPYTNKPEDIPILLNKLPETEIPTEAITPKYIKSLGFSIASSKNLFNILKMLGFINSSDKASEVWLDYSKEDKRASVLALAIKNTYANLFSEIMCPYLADDEILLDYLKQNVKATPREMESMLETFRFLTDPADFQDIMCEELPLGYTPPSTELEPVSNVKVDPNLQLNIQIHIDPNTPDEKIETIFKSMRKYLMGKE